MIIFVTGDRRFAKDDRTDEDVLQQSKVLARKPMEHQTWEIPIVG